MRLVDYLINEHNFIKEVFSFFNKKMHNSSDLSKLPLDFFIDFIDKFIDKQHRLMEERILLNELNYKAISHTDMRALENFIHEHNEEKNYLRNILHYYKNNDVENLISSMNNFIIFFQNHIKNEEVSFFPLILKYFSKAEINTIEEKVNIENAKVVLEHYKERAQNYH